MRRALSLCLAACAALGCGAEEAAAPPPATALSVAPRAVGFSFPTLDGPALTPESLAGRISVLAFIATYDSPSQGETQLLLATLRSHRPRINLALLVLEPPENRPLVETFVRVLDVTCPVAFADPETIAGKGPFAGLNQVPSLVVLDRQGREVARSIGFIDRARIERILHDVEAASGAPR